MLANRVNRASFLKGRAAEAEANEAEAGVGHCQFRMQIWTQTVRVLVAAQSQT